MYATHDKERTQAGTSFAYLETDLGQKLVIARQR